MPESQPILDYAPPPEFDTGRFVARYLQALALLSIASMVSRAYFRDQFYFDFTFIFLLWAASALKRRSRTARGWVLVISGLLLAFGLFSIVYLILSIPSGRSMSFSFSFGRIQDPPFWVALLILLTYTVISAVPFSVLLSPRAQRQFDSVPRTP